MALTTKLGWKRRSSATREHFLLRWWTSTFHINEGVWSKISRASISAPPPLYLNSWLRPCCGWSLWCGSVYMCQKWLDMITCTQKWAYCPIYNTTPVIATRPKSCSKAWENNLLKSIFVLGLLCMHMSRKHMAWAVNRHGQLTKNALFVMLAGLAKHVLKAVLHTDWWYLWLTQMPWCRDRVIFMPMITTQNDGHTSVPLVHACRVIVVLQYINYTHLQ